MQINSLWGLPNNLCTFKHDPFVRMTKQTMINDSIYGFQYVIDKSVTGSIWDSHTCMLVHKLFHYDSPSLVVWTNKIDVYFSKAFVI